MKKRIFSALLAVCLITTVFSAFSFAEKSNDIVILYENDVHCAIDGYSVLAAMKKEMQNEHEYVGVVSSGDFVQGSSLGAISQGEYIVSVMNLVGYDAITLGNHEFDYRIPRLLELVEIMNTKPVCCNFAKAESGETVFSSYSIVNYGNVDVAYIGITTPDTLTSSSPKQFLNADGSYAYTFNGDALYTVVQESINDAKGEGADVIIALTHLGTEDVHEKWSAQTLAQNTDGIDAVLDGHSHSVIEEMTVKDKSGNDVLISSTGTKFANIGRLTISGDEVSAQLISTESYIKTDAEVSAHIAQINEEYSILGERKIGTSAVNLLTVDENGNRIVRNDQTNIGDFCADAFRLATGADIGFINGGGIRTDIKAGDVTFNDILSVFPFNNRVCVVETTGKAIVDMLELGTLNYPNEDGSFQHVSGITFDLNKNIPSSVKLDENMFFVGVEGENRVTNVKVLNKETGKHEPIDLNAKYTLASHNYLLLEQGGGATMFKDAAIISDSGMLDVELLEVYITEYLGGTIGTEYALPQNRINIIETSAAEPPKTGDNAQLALASVLIGLSIIMAIWGCHPQPRRLFVKSRQKL